MNGFGQMTHTGFPVSILASLNAGYGEKTLGNHQWPEIAREDLMC